MEIKGPLIAGSLQVGNVSSAILKVGSDGTVAQAIPGTDYSITAQVTPNTLISGGGVVWTGNLNFTVSAATYNINGTSYSSPMTNISLGTADATFNRFDIIAVDSTGSVVIIPGTPAAAPILPAIDPSTQLQLTFVEIDANQTSPTNIATTNLYLENTEWTSSVSANFNAASTNNPYAGSKDIEATTATTTNFVQLQKPSGTIDLSTQNTLNFYIRSKASWASNRSLTIQWLNAGVAVGNGIVFQNSSYGFNSATTTSYQQIVIPISQFNVGATVVNQLKFTVGGSGGTIGFYLDNVTLQSGAAVAQGSFLFWKGTWNSTTNYINQDVVVYNGKEYVALLSNTNSAPSPTNLNWQSSYTQPHAIGATWDGVGSVLTTGAAKGFVTVPYSGVITGWSISVDVGTATIKVWKIATGTVVPTVSNNINTNGVSISTGTTIRSSTVSDFTTTTVTVGDIFAFNLSAVTSATQLTFTLEIT